MINYDEIEQVVENLKNLTSNLKSMGETQATLGGLTDKIDNSKATLEEINLSLGKHFDTIEEMEKDHSKIALQLETVIQDYKKLNSAFELLEIELKKIDSKNSDSLEKVRQLISTCDNISSKITNNILEKLSNISTNLEKNTAELQEQNKQTKIRFWTTIAGIGVLAVLAIVNLLI